MLTILAGLGFFAPSFANANALGIFSFFGDLTFTVISKVVYGAVYIITFIAGLAIAVEAWGLGVILKYSSTITTSAVVAYGFPASLAIANLGFILAIVVIAIMTILRMQSYGLKQVLWKLIVMAIAVNFGLVIASAILQVPQSLTEYFLNEINPASECTAGANCLDAFDTFATSLAGAFNPQKAFWNVDVSKVDPTDQPGLAQSFGSFLNLIAPLIFSVFFLFAIVLTLGAAVIMLIVRYVYLGYLLVLLPLAWASFIFPGTKARWSAWWSTFLKQAFFPMFLVFFLWLAVLTSQKISLEQGSGYARSIQGQNGILSAAAGGSGLLDQLLGPIAITLLQGSIVIGVAIAGLFTAQALGAFGAKGALDAFNATTKGFGQWVGRKGKRAASIPAGWMAKGASKLGDMATSKNRFTNAALSPLRVGANAIARGATWAKVVGGERLVKEAEGAADKMSSEELRSALRLPIAGEKRIAYLKALAKKDAINLGDLNGSDKKLFERFNQGNALKDVQLKAGGSVEMVQALTKDVEALERATKEFLDTIRKGDARNLRLQSIFDPAKPIAGMSEADREKFRKTILQQIVANRKEALVPNILPGLSAGAYNEFTGNFERQLLTACGGNREDERFKKWQEMLRNYEVTESPEPGTTPTPPTQPPAAAPPPPRTP